MNPQNFYSARRLQPRVERGATVAEIAAVMAALCQEVNAALSPIVGARGVAALHQRSHHCCAASRACMTSPCESTAVNDSAGFEVLMALQQQRDPDEALNVGEAYLQTFHDLFVSLVGPSLAERLLITVWPAASGSAPTQAPSEGQPCDRSVRDRAGSRPWNLAGFEGHATCDADAVDRHVDCAQLGWRT